jgi:hypothetical protein
MATLWVFCYPPCGSNLVPGAVIIVASTIIVIMTASVVPIITAIQPCGK